MFNNKRGYISSNKFSMNNIPWKWDISYWSGYNEFSCDVQENNLVSAEAICTSALANDSIEIQ